MGNYTFENLNSFFHHQIILNELEPLQSNLCDDHLCKATTRLRQPILSLPQQIPVHLLLYKTTTCLMRPATTFFVPQIKKKPI